MQLIHGDCLEKMKDIPDKSIDMILCDLPYGTTACKWDSVIDLPSLWNEYKGIVKDNRAICLFASQPFTTVLGASALEFLRYEWAWDKKFAGNFVQAKRMPLKVHENILVFCTSGVSPTYYPQMIERATPIKKGGNKQSKTIPIATTQTAVDFGNSKKIYEEKFPETVIEYNVREGRGLHPTQKPVSLLEYLIKTYTLEGETVLDNTMGSGSTGVACVNTGRDFIGIEKDDKYFEIAKKRIEEAIRGQSQN